MLKFIFINEIQKKKIKDKEKGGHRVNLNNRIISTERN